VNLETAIASVRGAPLDPVAHLALGDAYAAAGRPVPALACWRTARSLAAAAPDSRVAAAAGERLAGVDGTALLAAPALRDHNRFYRLRVLAAALREAAGRDDFSVVDIGGGDGALALHLPHTEYILVEPGTNGLSGENLPFPPGSADVVAACHVLEHVPPGDRDRFLDSLRRIARREVVLLGPFRVPGTLYRRRLQMVLDLTGAPWAREHLDCGLPDLQELEEYAARRGVSCRHAPVGAMPTALLATLVSHYAHLAGRAGELARLHDYLNAIAPDRHVNERLPGAYLVRLSP